MTARKPAGRLELSTQRCSSPASGAGARGSSFFDRFMPFSILAVTFSMVELLVFDYARCQTCSNKNDGELSGATPAVRL